jgi:cytochrome c peroxidase
MNCLHASGLAVASILGANLFAQQGYFPPPNTPAGNPVTTPKALLGMSLFWEEQMSSTNTTACGTCHIFSHGGIDPRATNNGHPGPDGLFGTADDIHGASGVPATDASGRYTGVPTFGAGAQITSRKAPTVINAAYQPSLFYDGRAEDGEFRDPVTNAVVLTGPVALENLIKGPPVNTTEMGHQGRSWTDVASKIGNARPLALASNIPARLQTFLGGARTYNELFQQVYGGPATPTRVIMSIATYLRTLVSDQTPYDRHLAGQTALNAAELRGLQQISVAHGQAASCIQCHGDLSAQSHTFGPTPLSTTMYGFQSAPNSHNTGVRPIPEDNGVGGITALATDQGRFRAPGLRNTSLHGTWFHTGAMNNLAAVVEFYDRGGDFHVNQATEIRPRGLTASVKQDIVAFLNALVDPRVQNETAPFDRPRLASESSAAPTRFGTGMTGTPGRTPQAVALEPVFVGGQRATIAVQNTVPNTGAFVLWDTVAEPQGYNFAGINLYLGLYQFSLTYAGQSTATGIASMPFAVPANPQLAGFHLYAQWLLIDPAAPIGVTSSDAIDIGIR